MGIDTIDSRFFATGNRDPRYKKTVEVLEAWHAAMDDGKLGCREAAVQLFGASVEVKVRAFVSA